MKTIYTKFHPTTNSRTARYTASDRNGNRIEILGFDYSAANNEQEHQRAAITLCRKMGWTGTIVGGRTEHGMTWFPLEATTMYAIHPLTEA